MINLNEPDYCTNCDCVLTWLEEDICSSCETLLIKEASDEQFKTNRMVTR